MKKLIRNISVMVALAAVTSTQAQFLSLDDQGDFSEMDYDSGLFESNNTPGGSPQLPDDDPTDDEIAPINDYAPLLVLGGIAVYAFSRKKFQLK